MGWFKPHHSPSSPFSLRMQVPREVLLFFIAADHNTLQEVLTSLLGYRSQYPQRGPSPLSLRAAGHSALGDNMKWPNPALCRGREPWRLILKIYTSTFTLTLASKLKLLKLPYHWFASARNNWNCCIFSLVVIAVEGYVAASHNCPISKLYRHEQQFFAVSSVMHLLIFFPKYFFYFALYTHLIFTLYLW